jgi:hypothetical protein
MYLDCRGLAVTASSPQSAALLDEAVSSYLGARKDTLERVAAVLNADGENCLAWCLKGYLLMHAGKPESVRCAETALAKAKEAAVSRREKLHIAALEAWIHRDFESACQQWRAILESHPRDVLALRLAQFMNSYLGDSDEVRDCVARALPAWDEGVPGYGFVLGCYAYGLEESGQFELAESCGRRAVKSNITDLWAAHAVTHVMEMQGRPRDGISWISDLQAHWSECNNFVFHVKWHRCLFHLALEEFDRVLAIYDREVRSQSTDEYLDITNAAALLWRLEQANVAVGERWGELAERSAGHLEDHLFILADLHYLIALAARGEPGVTTSFLESCAQHARAGAGTEARVMNSVGLTVAKAIVAHRRGSYTEAADLLFPVRGLFRRIGGSHAQRDIFDQMLIDSAVRSGRSAMAKSLLVDRTAARPHDIWSWRSLVNLYRGLNDAASANAAQAQLQNHFGSLNANPVGSS